MATKLADAYVQIIPSAEGISSGIQKVIDNEVGEAGNNTGKGFASKFLGTATSVIGAGVGAVTAAATAVWSAASDIASAGDEIDKSSQKIGVSTDQYQALAYMAGHCGFEVSTLQTAAKKLATTDFDGNLTDALNTIMAVEDASERTALATELLGERATQQMAAFLNGEQSMDDYMSSLEALGGVMSNDAVMASAQFEDNLADLQVALGGLKTNMVSQFLPSMNTVMQGITALVTGDENGLALVKEGIEQFLNDLGEMIPQLLDIGLELILSFADVIIDNLPMLIETGIQLIIKLAVGIIKALPQLIAKVPEIIKGIVVALKNSIPELMKAGKDLIIGLWNGINNAKDWLWGKIKEFTSGVTSKIKDFFGIHSPSKVMADQIGKFLPMGMAEGIEEASYLVDEAMEDLGKEAIEKGKIATELDMVGGMRQAEYNVQMTTDNKLDALINLLNQYLPNMNNLQVVMDSGVLVGEIAPQMNTSLGRMVIRNGRGG